MRLDTKEKRAQYRASMIPAGAERDPRSSEAGEAYTYERVGVLYSIAFWGGAGKPHFHYRHRGAEERAKRLTEFFASTAGHREYVNKRNTERAAFRHTLKVGDIVHTSWGYDQTNVSFFEVTRIVSDRSVGIRPIKSTLRAGEGCSPMAGYVTGCAGEYCGDEIVRRVREGNYVVNAEYSYGASLGAGPTYCSWYA